MSRPSNLDRAIDTSAAPADARLAVERIAAAHPDVLDRLAADHATAGAVVAVTAASRSLTRLLEADGTALDVLADLGTRPAPPPAEGGADELARWKRLEYLRIAARDLLGLDGLDATGAALAELATDVLRVACELADAGGLAVIGMGKLGGAELNYASDVDLVFVGDGDGGAQAEVERRARAVVDIARRCFRIDLNLRPEGRDGPLVRSVPSFEAYWDRWAQPWEFQALLKARPVAGAADVGARFADAAAARLWSTPFDAEALRSVRDLKERAEAEVARRGVAEREVKRGPGGIRDIEFAVQLLQLVHGPLDPELRSPTTLVTLAELADAGYIDRHDAERLDAAYRFLRVVEHRLQLADEQQVHTVPADARGRDRLARVVGYRGSPAADAGEQLDDDLRRHQATVRAIHERLYFRPLLEAFSATDGGTVMTAEAAEARLTAFGFTDAARTRQAVAELTRGLTRSSRLMQQMLPLVLDWLSVSPDPDVGLLGLRNVTSGPQRSMELASAFRDSPEVARRLCLLLGTSRVIGSHLQRNPDLIASLGSIDDLRLRSRSELIDGARRAVAMRPSNEQRRVALKRFTDREGLRIMVHDVLGMADTATVGAALSAVAEAAMTAVVELLAPGVPFAVVAVGRFGGAELNYQSDLDVVFVYDGTTAGEFAEAERVATDLLRFVGGSIPIVYQLDPSLRPEGKQGPLARSIEGFRAYFERYAEPWERMAMVRARPSVGDADVSRRFFETLAPLVWRGVSPNERREIRRIKARVERERIPPGEDPQFHLKLGRGSLSDVEFTAQLLQLEHGVPSQSTDAALERLVAAGALDGDDWSILSEAYRFCEHTRNRLFLVNSGPGDSLPSQPQRLTKLARSLGTSPTALRDDYRRVTRRARRVVERVFYGGA